MYIYICIHIKYIYLYKNKYILYRNSHCTLCENLKEDGKKSSYKKCILTHYYLIIYAIVRLLCTLLYKLQGAETNPGKFGLIFKGHSPTV